jgi:hypothetical protein
MTPFKSLGALLPVAVSVIVLWRGSALLVIVLLIKVFAHFWKDDLIPARITYGCFLIMTVEHV